MKIKPEKLQKGDTIGVVALSKFVSKEKLDFINNAVERFKSLGLNVVLGDTCFKIDKYQTSAGEPEERAEELHKMFSNPDIKAVYCALGGDTILQIVSLIDYELIKSNPKIFIGMSDNDVVSLAIYKMTGLITFNGSDFFAGKGFDFDFEYTWQSFQKRLFQKEKTILPYRPRITLREGQAEGKILGCNLSSILKLAGTKYFPDFEDSILFLESYFATPEKSIYQLQQLKEIGVFEKIKGLVVGFIAGFEDKELREKNQIPDNIQFEDILLDVVNEYDFPILKTHDFGHRNPTCYLPIGVEVCIDADKKHIEIKEDFLV